MSAHWFCEVHRLTVRVDCPKCDDEQIALHHYVQTCHKCGRGLTVSDFAWADDVKVIEPGGIRVETRYTCDDCEAAA